MKNWHKVCAAGVGTLLALATSPAAKAANITFLQLAADPAAVGQANLPEFVYSAVTGLGTGPGAVGNGNVLAPGMVGQITGGVPGIPFSPPGIGFGPTYQTLADLTLTLTGFAPVGSALAGATTLEQNLGDGTFTVSYNGIGAAPLVLITGTARGATLTEKDTNSNAVVTSAVVTYTGGYLLPFISDSGPTTGGFAFSMTGVNGVYGVTPVANELHLSDFVADGGATFDAVPLTGGGPDFPEPTGVSLLIGGYGVMALRRRVGRA